MNSKLLNRFIEYISIETTSDPKSNLHPSNIKEFDLLSKLEKEMKSCGLQGIKLSKEGFLYGYLPKNSDSIKDIIGFIAHVDTSSDMSGKNIGYQIIEDYDGEDVILNKEENIKLDTKEFAFLKNLKGKTLITTKGKTLLGADDKAGVAEIMQAIEEIKADSSLIHGDIYVAFTPDEEIGEGTMFFDKKLFPCDYAYTIDGGKEGEINYENFNAASAKVTIKGKNIHPGSAKNHMINSILVSEEFNEHLDQNAIPSKTEKYEGFNHLNSINGCVEETILHYIIRNHNKELFQKQKQDFLDIQNKLNEKYQYDIVKVEIEDSYFNMYDIIKNHMEIVEKVKQATIQANVTPIIVPIRGGTDGAMLTYKGINTPNIGTGGFNFHGKYECITLEGMKKVVQIIKNIIKLTK